MKKLYLVWALAVMTLFTGCEKRALPPAAEDQPPAISDSSPGGNAVVVDEVVPAEEAKEKFDPPILFHLNGLYGYMNKQLQVVIPPIYNNATHFSDDGYAAVRCEIGDGSWEGRILDYEGNILFHENTSYIRLLYDDVICYSSNDDNLYRVIRFKSNTILVTRLGAAAVSTEDGIILVRFFDSSAPGFIHVGYAYVDGLGKRILPHLKMQRISRPFREQRAVITDENGDMHIIDLEGKILGRYVYQRLGNWFSEGLLPAQTQDDHTGYVDRNGDFAFTIPLISENEDYYLAPLMATEFRDGYAFIQTKRIPSAWQIINKQGQYVSEELPISNAYAFAEGLSCVRTNEGMYGYVNTNGEMVIEAVFEKADSFHKGYARIVYQGRDGLLISDGQVFWSDEISTGSVN
jgi:hypothetical protein